MSNDLPFDNSSAGSAIDPEEDLNNIIHERIRNLGASIEALSFCVREMLLSDETDNASLKPVLDNALPGLMDETIAFVRRIVNSPANEVWPKEQRELTIGGVWPEHAIDILFARFGIQEDDYPIANYSNHLGYQTAMLLAESLDPLHEIFYSTILNYLGYTEEELPTTVIYDVVQFAKNNGDFVDGKSFKQWFEEARQILETPIEQRSQINFGSENLPN